MLELVKEIVLGKAEAGGGGGQTINNEDMTITSNGEYTASEGYTGIGTATVNVPQPTGTISITANGTADVNDYQYADVNVPQYEEKTVTNKTGSAISNGDKVWVDGSDIKSFIDTTYGDFTKTGSPTITNGVASGFSATNYIVPKCQFDNAYNANAVWEWNVKFNIETISQFNSILGGDSGSYLLDLYVGVANKLGINISGNATSYNIAEGVLGTTVLSASTDYWVKFGWTGSVYYVDLSTDGKTFTREISVNSSSPALSYSYPNHPLCIGFRVGTYFHGSVDLKETSFSLKNTTEQRAYIWRAYDILIDSSAVTGVAKETIANNASGKVGIGELGRKYGATINNFLGDVNASGVLQAPQTTNLNFVGVKEISLTNTMSNAFMYNKNVGSVSFPDLTTVPVNALSNTFQYSSATSASFPKLENISNPSCLSGTFMGSNVSSIDFSSLKTISGSNSFSQVFGQCKLTSLVFPELTTVSSGASLQSAFYSNTLLTSVSFPKLTSASKLDSTFSYCSALTSVSFPELTTVSDSIGLTYCFNSCTSLTTITFPKLAHIQASFSNTFKGCTSLTDVYFPAFTSTSFGNYLAIGTNMLSGVTGCTVHFPSNLQAVIGSWSDVTSGFGGTNTVVAYDLPATE